MYSKIKIAGHPVHPMLVAFPVAFYTAALVCYIVYNSNSNPFWFKVAVVANIAGVAMAALAAIPGFIDWLNIPTDSKAKKTGIYHMLCNVAALVCFGIAALVEYKKWDDATPSLGLAIPLTALGFILTLAAGFLGWTLVQKHHVGVDDDKPEISLKERIQIRQA
ncbi:hypothetical protein A3860_09000 [Niastella vici]|uniref:DUF2231 domain-containing protein n=1 Tax=Niastella vici TaxID=1703345 RepID=A0A1V9FHB9_9BACT|nr:DUF2231 domain-containing protein [Niastella vici]OQP57754.1 hypothetical protein A3860_09000 [Niastella vici]